MFTLILIIGFIFVFALASLIDFFANVVVTVVIAVITTAVGNGSSPSGSNSSGAGNCISNGSGVGAEHRHWLGSWRRRECWRRLWNRF